jgi:hypothetical protein
MLTTVELVLEELLPAVFDVFREIGSGRADCDADLLSLEDTEPPCLVAANNSPGHPVKLNDLP